MYISLWPSFISIEATVIVAIFGLISFIILKLFLRLHISRDRISKSSKII